MENEHHDPHHHEGIIDPTVKEKQEIVTNLDRPPLLSWGSLLAGLVCTIAISWLLYLLGLALGVSIADVSDGDAIGQGLSIGAIVWMVISCLVAYFVGALLAARLCGKIDSTVGMLHGLTHWSLVTTLMVVLSYWGVTSLLQTGYSMTNTAVSTVASVSSDVASTTVSATDSLAGTVADAADTELVDSVQARLKRRASSVVARPEKEGSVDVTTEEVSEAIESLDAKTLKKVATHLAMGEMRSAREELADGTNLSEKEVSQIVEGIGNEFEEQLGTDGNNTDLVGDISNAIERQTSDFVADLDAQGGPNVSQSEVRKAFNEMTPAVSRKVATRLASGNVQGAKDVLTANTNLTANQVNDVVDGVNEDVSRTIQKYQNQASQAVEAASTYAQAVLWTVFVASAMGLAISLLGGWLGTDSTRRIEVEVERHPTIV